MKSLTLVFAIACAMSVEATAQCFGGLRGVGAVRSSVVVQRSVVRRGLFSRRVVRQEIVVQPVVQQIVVPQQIVQPVVVQRVFQPVVQQLVQPVAPAAVGYASGVSAMRAELNAASAALDRLQCVRNCIQ